MSQEIHIVDGIAKKVEITILEQAKLEDLDKHLIAYKPTLTTVMPDNVRVSMFDPNTQTGKLLIHRAPKLETINIHYDMGANRVNPTDWARKKTGERDDFKIMFPWLSFLYTYRLIDGPGLANHGREHPDNFSIDSVRVYWSRDQIRKLSDNLWIAKMPNLQGGGEVCWGTTRADTTSLAARIDQQVKTFHRTPFNNHLTLPVPHGMTSYDDWEKNSVDPLAYLNWTEWQQPPVGTVEALMGTAGFTGQQLTGDGEAVWNVPEPPTVFTFGRAREWAKELGTREPRLKRVFLAAIIEELANTPTRDDEIAER